MDSSLILIKFKLFLLEIFIHQEVADMMNNESKLKFILYSGHDVSRKSFF